MTGTNQRQQLTLTDYIELEGVTDAAVLVFHHTGIVSLVRGEHRLHDECPHTVTHLKILEKPMLQQLLQLSLMNINESSRESIMAAEVELECKSMSNSKS